MKTVVITGAGRGLGKYLVEHLEKNYNVCYLYRSTNLNTSSSFSMKCDVRDEKEVEAFFKEVLKRYKKVDIIINNASINYDKEFLEKTKEEFLDVYNTIVVGAYNILKYSKMKEGLILNIGSNNAIDSYYPESADYDAAKTALISLTKNIAKRFAPKIRANYLALGWLENTSINPELKKSEEKRILLKRFAKLEEIKDIIEFLISEKAYYINSSVIKVDGGING